MNYHLNPKRHTDLARTLLEREYSPEVANFLHARFLDGSAFVHVRLYGCDKDGPFEDANDNALRDFDPDTLHTQYTTRVHFTGATPCIEAEEIDALRGPRLPSLARTPGPRQTERTPGLIPAINDEF